MIFFQALLENMSPIAFEIGPFAVHWYGISYLLGLLTVIAMLVWLNKKAKVFKDSDQIFDYGFWVFLFGVLLGGRLGYVLFYNLSYYLQNPLKIPAVWDGGMSFHGGLIGVIVVTYLFFKKHKLSLLKAGDIIVIPTGIAIALTRLANFVNHELYGRIIANPNFKWLGLDFGDGLLRYPSQLFQSASGLLLFLILILIYQKFKLKNGVTLFTFFILQGVFRFLIEFVREPDAQLGFIVANMTMGQLLALAQVLLGSLVVVYLYFYRPNH